MVNADDQECSGSINSTISSDRKKFIVLTIQNNITEEEIYIALLSAALFFIGFSLIYIFGAICFKIHHPGIPNRPSFFVQNKDHENSDIFNFLSSNNDQQVRIIISYIFLNILI